MARSCPDPRKDARRRRRFRDCEHPASDWARAPGAMSRWSGAAPRGRPAIPRGAARSPPGGLNAGRCCRQTPRKRTLPSVGEGEGGACRRGRKRRSASAGHDSGARRVQVSAPGNELELAPPTTLATPGSMHSADPHVIVLFGATGDLARREAAARPVPPVPGRAAARVPHRGHVARGALDDEYHEMARTACDEFARGAVTDEHWDDFRRTHQLRARAPRASTGLAGRCRELEAMLDAEPRRLHYLSIPPHAADAVVQTLGEAGLTDRARIIMEKPFGTDLHTRTAPQLAGPRGLRRRPGVPDRPLPGQGGGAEHPGLPLRQRALRADLEPPAHRPHPDRRARDPRRWSPGPSFYEQTGAFRDMVVTHLFQILAFVAMEPPTDLEPRAINEEKNKVFRSMRPIDPAARGPGPVRGVPLAEGVAPDSDTETFVALRVRDRQLAVGRRPVLPAHRQADGRGRPHRLDRLPRAAEVDVPAPARGWAPRGRTT